ncbi:hypothetical protein [Streptomyces griseorubiginosus]|uniref:hypothetical protein n=1 Tax=Streptomyces griseorubiginosus TaxID=67304 RepID=UPI001AD6D209|nr:hypothetical protein [Streptomyces griseorubiginosus]MBO4260470.1 hypothetical protein [Streptomyces griseorubiginosus]
MARQAKILYYGSQGAPLLAGWGNLAHTHPGEPWVTGPNFLKGAKKLPVIGAGGTPFYNWHWSTDG